MSYKLSVIIPCFNCAPTLAEAVRSCFDQGFSETELEIVLCNDASSDNTSAVIAELGTQHSNIQIVTHSTNRGGGAARNTAARAASAPVVFCLDSDDVLPAGTLRKMYDYLIAQSTDGVGLHHSTKFKGTDTTLVVRVDTFSHAGERIPLENLLQKNNDLCSLYSVFMFTKTAFTTIGGYPEHHGFDTQGFAWRFLAAGLSAHVCPDTNYLHRVAFHQSYYLREYRDGRENINWQAIFLEHFHLFSPAAQALIKNFPARDFTRSLFEELKALESILVAPSEQAALMGKSRPQNHPLPTPIHRDSIHGILLRIRAKLLH